MTTPSRLKPLIPGIQEAGQYMRSHFRGPLTIEQKSSVFDLVTQVDKQVESMILKALKSVEPDVPVISEENHYQLGGNASSVRHEPDQLYWTLDPLDGTANFAMGVPFFCISLALCSAEGPLVSVIHNPWEDEWFVAEKGKGAFLNGNKLEVSHQPVESGLVSMRIKNGSSHASPNMQNYLGCAGGMRSLGAAALELAYVSCGRLVAYQEVGLKLWDIAAGVLLVREAGGIAEVKSPLAVGEPIEVNHWSVTAVNPTVYEQIYNE